MVVTLFYGFNRLFISKNMIWRHKRYSSEFGNIQKFFSKNVKCDKLSQSLTIAEKAPIPT